MELVNAEMARELAKNPEYTEAKESVEWITNKIIVCARNGQRKFSCYIEPHKKDYVTNKMKELGYEVIDTQITVEGNPLLDFKW